MTDEHRQRYSGLLAGMRKTVRATAKRAAPVDKVAAAVVKAVTAERPRTRYVVGTDARGQTFSRPRCRTAPMTRWWHG
jgi:hypothetical protein